MHTFTSKKRSIFRVHRCESRRVRTLSFTLSLKQLFFFRVALSWAFLIFLSSSVSSASSSLSYLSTTSQPASLLLANLIIFCRFCINTKAFLAEFQRILTIGVFLRKMDLFDLSIKRKLPSVGLASKLQEETLLCSFLVEV